MFNKDNIKKWHDAVFKKYATGGIVAQRHTFFGNDTPYLIVPLTSDIGKRIIRMIDDRENND
jgi:hypothetical protein